MTKNSTLAVAAGGAAVLITLGGWWAIPSLQAKQAAAESEASEHAERARRLLHRYNPGLDYRSLLLADLAEAGVDTTINDPQVILDAAGDEIEEYIAKGYELYQPADRDDPPRPVKLRGGAAPGMIRGGITGRKEMVRLNEQFLKEALAEVDRGLAVRAGDASAATYAPGLRLKSVILQQMGLRECARAGLKRLDVGPVRAELMRLATQAAVLKPIQTLLTTSGVAEQIHALQSRLKETQAKLGQDRGALEQIESRIGELEKRLSEARDRMASARQTLDAALQGGVDPKEPGGPADYRKRVEAADAAFRDAMADVQALESGRYGGAVIDAAGDYLKSAYVPATDGGKVSAEFGLEHFRFERAIASAVVAGGERGLADLQADIARLEVLRDSQSSAQEQSTRALATIQSEAAKVYEELAAIEADADKIEDQAIKYFDQSQSAAKQAADGAARWVNDARSQTQNLSPEARGRSGVARRLQDQWMSGFTQAHVADALLAKAQVHANRYAARSETASALTEVTTTLQIPDADVQEVEQTAKDAQAAGLAAVQDAVGTLERVHRDVGNHWTITAQAAAAMYLGVFLGNPDAAGDAVEAYRAAVKGREDKPFAARITSRLRQLESRK